MLRYGILMTTLLASPAVEPSYHAAQPFLGRFAPSGRAAKWLGYVDKFVVFPFKLASIAARSDVVHICDQSNALYCRFTGPVPTLLTCHDLLAVRAAAGEFAAHRPGAPGRVLQWLIRTSLRRADHIVCVSEATAADVERLIPGVPTSVIENPIRDMHRAAPNDVDACISQLGLRRGAYFLHIGGNQWYKNRAGVVAMFAALRARPELAGHRLVLAGKPLPAELVRQIDAFGVAGQITHIRGPSDAQLSALYAGAEALLFPSLAEGFGWPIIEAQAVGCPVVTSNRPPMRDIAGTAGAILVDPEQPDAAAQAYVAARDELHRYRRAGHQNIARFARDDAAARYRALLFSLVSHGTLPSCLTDQDGPLPRASGTEAR